jgi:hypothetical protein
MQVPRGQIGPRTVPSVLVLDAQRLAGGYRRRRVAAFTRLNTRLFIGRDHIVTRPQWAALPPALYRSRMGPARSANRESRGKSQLRHRQGRIASASSQRQSVVPLMVATTPAQRPAPGLRGADRATTSAPRAPRRPSAARTPSASPQRRRWGEKRAVRPPRGSSSRPARRSRKKRLRHLLMIWRGVSKRAAMMSLDSPSAANRMSLARRTSRYGDVYLRALTSISRRTARVSSMRNGLWRGTQSPHLLAMRIAVRAGR